MSKQLRHSKDILPAKLTPPTQINITKRLRLFELLDHAWSKPIVWISAPAGAGKTTLVASYLLERKLKPLWYQIDLRDNDPATFFAYLRTAISHYSPKKNETLVHFTAEYHFDLPVFTQNFFETVFSRLPDLAVIVLDNYQDVAENAALHEILPIALSQIPPHIHVFVLSRNDPPNTYAALRASQKVFQINGDELQLTLSEADEIAAMQQTSHIDADLLHLWHERVQGWTAGWILLLDRLGDSAPLNKDIPFEAREIIFDYFASELFENAIPLVRDVLIKTAFLPQITLKDAIELSENEQAGNVLDQLVRRNMFTTRLVRAEKTYRFHPMFREFLLAQGHHLLSQEERHRLTNLAAKQLVRAGYPDQAYELFVETNDISGLIDLVHANAPALAAQGRFSTLKHWLSLIPQETLSEFPWLEYWDGCCLMTQDPARARDNFERAYNKFSAANEPLGSYLACTSAVDTLLYQWDDLSSVDYWIGEINKLLNIFPLESYQGIEPRVVSSALNLLSFARSDSPDLAHWVTRAHSLFESVQQIPLRLILAGGLQMHYAWMGNIKQLRILSEQLAELVTKKGAEPFSRLYGYCSLATGAWLMGDVNMAIHWSDIGLEYGAEQGIHSLDLFILAQGIYASEISNDVDGVTWRLEKLRKLPGVDSLVQQAHYLYHATWLDVRNGDHKAAQKHIQRSLQLAETSTARFPILIARAKYAEILLQDNEDVTALHQLNLVYEYASQMPCHLMQMTADLLRAYCYIRQNNHSLAAEYLSRGLLTAQEHDYTTYPNYNSSIVAELCQFALEARIESDFVRHLIRLRNLRPHGNLWNLESWHWPIKIYTLGRFRLLIDDVSHKLSGKNSELLKAILSLGGRDVDEQHLAEALWPEAEGDYAHRNLAITLHRLRKIIGTETLIYQDGKISINAKLAWVDAWAFERLIGAYDFSRSDESLTSIADSVLRLYQGNFLSADTHTWILNMRERLGSKFLRTITHIANNLCTDSQFDTAIRSYQKALEIDPSSEKYYQGLMYCYYMLKRPAEGLTVYHRCREVLARELGVPPCEATERLHAQLKSLTNLSTA